MENEEIALSGFRSGMSGRITVIKTQGTIRSRLKDLGFARGTRVTMLFSSFCGDPIAFLVRGAVIALRKNDCDNIFALVSEEEMHK